MKELSSWILKCSPSCLWSHFTYFRMCVNSSEDKLGIRLESPESHQELQHQKAGKVWNTSSTAKEGRGPQETTEDMGCLVGRPVPIKGEAGRVNLGRRRDFLVFRCWPVTHEKLILILPGKPCTVDWKSWCAVKQVLSLKTSPFILSWHMKLLLLPHPRQVVKLLNCECKQAPPWGWISVKFLGAPINHIFCLCFCIWSRF